MVLDDRAVMTQPWAALGSELAESHYLVDIGSHPLIRHHTAFAWLGLSGQAE